MKWVLIIFLVIVALILLISIIKLKIKVDILLSKDQNHIKIKITALFGLISYTYDVPFLKIDNESPTPSLVMKSEQKVGSEETTTSKEKYRITPNEVMGQIRKAKEFLEHVVHLHAIVRKFMKHISIHKLDWNSALGVGEASQTGMATGVLWSLKGAIVGIISQYMKLKAMPELSVTPFFQENLVRTRVICIFSFRIGHAIGGALRVVKYWKRSKGGKQHVRTSNTRLNDNSYGKLEAND